MKPAIPVALTFVFIAVIAAAVTPAIEDARIAADVARTHADLRSLATGIESYYVDNMQYPLSGRSEPLRYLLRDPETHGKMDYVPGTSVNSRCTSSSWSYHTVTFRVPDAGQRFSTVTTPIAYLERHCVDPFADDARATYGYFKTLNSWVAFSPGPRRWPEQPVAEYALDPELPPHDQLLPLAGYSDLSPSDIANYSFDATNSATARGFLFRRKQ